MSKILDKNPRYGLYNKIICLASAITAAMAFFTLPSKSTVLVLINMILFGFAVFPSIPLAYQYAVELTFPASENISNGIMIMLA